MSLKVKCEHCGGTGGRDLTNEETLIVVAMRLTATPSTIKMLRDFCGPHWSIKTMVTLERGGIVVRSNETPVTWRLTEKAKAA